MNVFLWVRLNNMPSQNQLLWLGDQSKAIVKLRSHVQEVVQPHLTTRNDDGGGEGSQRKLICCLLIKEDTALS